MRRKHICVDVIDVEKEFAHIDIHTESKDQMKDLSTVKRWAMNFNRIDIDLLEMDTLIFFRM